MVLRASGGDNPSRLIYPPGFLPPHHRMLLEAAERYITAGEPTDLQVAVVLAQTAAELRTEQAFDQLEAEAAQPELAKWARRRLRDNYNLANDTVRDLYVALSGH